jgi:hypothetical protein
MQKPTKHNTSADRFVSFLQEEERYLLGKIKPQLLNGI